MPRILVAGLFHETHTFLDGVTSLADFQIRQGEEMLMCKGDASPLGGVLEAAAEWGWEVVPTTDYRATPSAIVADEVIESFWADLKQRAEPALAQGLDGIYLVLHGAMASQSLVDVEGDLLRRLRALPGAADLPLFGVFDLHANFTQQMAELSDCLVAYQKNPHTDARDAGLIAARLLKRCLETGQKPRQFWCHPPLMWPPTGTGTAAEPMLGLESIARRLETTQPEIWSANVVAGFSFADTPDTGVSFVIASTGTGESAEAALSELADYAMAHKEEGNVTEPALESVLDQIDPPPPGVTVLVEPSDNIGAGAPGDGTGILRGLIARKTPNALVCLNDPLAVDFLRAAQIGERVQVSVGGRGSSLDAGPLDLEVEVVSHGSGLFELEDKNSHLASMNGDRFDMGPCVVVRHAGITLLLTSRKTPPFDLGQFRSQGIEPTRFAVIGVKAAVAHRRAYDPIAARMLWVDTPGPCSSVLSNLPFQNVQHPIYPLDPL